MTDQPSPADPSSHSPDKANAEERVEEIAARYLDLLKAGVAPYPEALAAAYPEIGESIRRRLSEVIESFERQSGTLTTPPPLDAPERTTTRATVRSDRAERVGRKTPQFARQGESTIDVDASDHPEEIGPYKILEPLGVGGMGAVYLAEQTRPVRRRVALKLIKLGMDTREVVARFESERQALALMDHPNIARVFDAGATDVGRPYFVMEHVRGEPLTDYCDKQRLTTEQRLVLFQQVCDGVQHAHQKGIIHRDLKPSNILVSVPNGKPMAKIIDFGIAKATNQRLTEQTIFTEMGRIIGTPEYMSPEQAEATSLDVDTRTDIYSLGVVLYRLLVGALPFDTRKLREGGYDEIRRKIREDEPKKPSTRLSTLEEGSDRIARDRQTDPTTLGKLLRGDLDWITMKAMEKDRTRRYATASELSADIQRHMDDDPVIAGPPGATYRMKKLLKKYRGPVLATLGMATILIAGLAVSITMYVRAERAKESEIRQRKLAEEATDQAQLERDAARRAQVSETEQRERAEAAQEEAQTERGKAESEADKATAISDFLREMLASVDPGAQGRDVRVADVLDEAAKKIETAFPEQPLVEAVLRDTIGVTYRSLGLYDAAEPHFRSALDIVRRVLGEDDPETLNALNNLAVLEEDRGRLQDGEKLYRQVLEARRRLQGEDHRDTLTAMNNLALTLVTLGNLDEAEKLLRQVLMTALRVLGEDDHLTLMTTNNLAGCLKDRGSLAEAEPFYRNVVERGRRVHGEDHPLTLAWMNNLAALLAGGAGVEEGERMFRRVLEARRRILRDDHPHTLESMNNLGQVLAQQGKLEDAEKLHRHVLEKRRPVFGNEHPLTLTSMNNLATVLREVGKLEETELLFRETLATSRRLNGDAHPDTLISLNNLAALLEDLGKLGDAEMMFREALETSRRLVGDDHPFTLITMNNLALLLEDLGKSEDGEKLHRRVLEARRRTLGETHPDTLVSMNNLGRLLRVTGELAEADRLLARAVRLATESLPQGDWRTAVFRSNYGACLTKMERFEEAERQLLASHAVLRPLLASDHRFVLKVLQRLVDLYTAWGKPEKAEEYKALLSTSKSSEGND
ncbi:MAG: tetratricopeptide repeat protein [Planctomycetota bacterium]|nr:tetratricopeptide repeat protein [Planctomycetota bacterium]